MQDNQNLNDYQQAAEILKKARHVLAFTGAGISVPSGIPDFRSPGGIWSKYDPMKVATAEALIQNPKQVWEFLLETIDMLEGSYPNAAHEALAGLERKGRLHGVITQNIDNLHQRAGSREVIEYHGNFQRFYCQSCHDDYPYEKIRKITSMDIPLYCHKCKGLIRPDVVFFGESIPAEAHKKSQELVSVCEVIIIAGTSGEVAPANIIPRQVRYNGGQVIEINLGSTSYEDITTIRFNDSVEKVLPGILEELNK